MGLEGACAVTRQVASGLAFMHEKNRNHNDIRPENILLKRAPEGGHLQVKLAVSLQCAPIWRSQNGPRLHGRDSGTLGMPRAAVVTCATSMPIRWQRWMRGR